MELKEGQLLFFPKFVFSNGEVSEGKFFLVLKNVAQDVILVSLPSSRKNIPAKLYNHTGCYYDEASRLSFYAFRRGVAITECGFTFDKDTLLYGNYLQTYSKSSIKSKYPTEGEDYQVKGVVCREVMIAIHKCFREAKSVVKRKYQRMLFV